MIPIIPEAIEKYAETYSSPESALLKELARETYKKAKYPQMQVGHLEGSFLRMLAQITGAKHVLEIGTFTGYSALCLAEGMPADGTLITCDIDPETTKIAKKFWDRSPHGKKIKLMLGPALETLKSLTSPFDLAFIDADKENYRAYWEAILPKLRTGGLMAVDNVLWSGRVLQPKCPTDRAIHAFNRHAAKDPRVKLIMASIRDGITLAIKK